MFILLHKADAQTPTVLNVEGGKYFHYGIENAVNGQSPGVLHFQKDLFQFINIHQQDPTVLPFLLRKKVRSMYKYNSLKKSKTEK